MRYLHITIILTVFIIQVFESCAYAQVVKPVAPDLQYVSVDTSTNHVDIFWKKSSSAKIARYNIYQMVKRGNDYEEGDSIGSVSPSQLSFTDLSVIAGTKSVHYSIAAVDSSEFKSDLSSTHGTIYLSVRYDSCASTITLDWNKYLGWGEFDGGAYVHGLWGSTDTVIAIDPNFNSSYVFERVSENTAYSFFIEGVNSRDGYTSLSNIVDKFTYMPLPPANLQINYVTVKSPNTIDLNFSFDTPTEISSFTLLRSNNELSEFSRKITYMNVSISSFTIQDSLYTGLNSYFYKIGALNNCQSIISESNTGNNILLVGLDTLINNLHYNLLTWNTYKDFPLLTSGYELYRIDESGDSIILSSPGTSETHFLYDISEIYGQDNKGRLLYFIKAIENGSNQAYSNVCEVEVKTEVWLPNAFTPNGDGKNDVFEAKLNFIPTDFLMIIYDRAGIAVFSSEDPNKGWDGKINGNAPAPEGVYLYHVQYTSYNSQKVTKTGSLTVFYPR